MQITAPVSLMPPKIYLNGFPKSGLHLADRMALGILQEHNKERNWLGTNAWTVERHHLDEVGMKIASLKHGQFIKGHMGHLMMIEAAFIAAYVGVVFIYRDLRDVLVSQKYHVLSKNGKLNHTGKGLYRNMKTDEKVMLAIINGLPEYPGLFDRWETFAPWLESKWALSMPFEQMINNPYLASNRLFDYAFELSKYEAGQPDAFIDSRSHTRNAAIESIRRNMGVRHSTTLRTGKTGNWKEEFTPRVKEAFKKKDKNNWLVRLGYAKDDNW